MNNAELYIQQNLIQTKEMRDLLSKFSEKFAECKNGARVEDLGCADGDATVNVLMLQIKDCIHMTGLNLSPEIIQFANEKFASANVSFDTLDIGTKSLPPQYINAFDKVFSFNCIHWVPAKRQVFKNISDMLVNNGEMFLNFTMKLSIYKSRVTLSKTTKWGKYLSKIDRYYCEASENRNINDVLRLWKRMFNKLDLEVRCLETCTNSFLMDSEDAVKSNSVMAISYQQVHLIGLILLEFWSQFDACLKDIPEDQQNDYLTDFESFLLSTIELFLGDCHVVRDNKNRRSYENCSYLEFCCNSCS